jgi:tetratricopeptide (TPR) repeat protein
MTKLTAFFIIILFVILAVLAIFNKGMVDITVWENTTYQVPVYALILISTSVGILFMFIIVVVRDARRYLDSWQVQRQQKKELKIQESYSKGLNAFFAFRYEESTELFDRIIESDPSHINALLRLGDMSLRKGDFIRAKDFYLRAKEIKPRNIEILLSLTTVSESQQKWQEALKYLESILEIDDENIHILHMKRDIFEKNRKWDDVIEVQNKILKCKLLPEEELEENKKLLGYKYELGRYYIEVGDADKSIKTLKDIIKKEENFAAAYLALAEAYVRDGNTKEAEDMLLKGHEATSSLVILARLEDHYIAEGEPGKIIDIYQHAIQKNRKDPGLQFFLAKLYYRLEMIDYAQDTLNSIDVSAFDCPDLHVLRGSVHERRAELQEAIEEFKKALNAEKPLLVPFCCQKCSYTSNDWSGRCPDCKNWNTFILDIHEICKTEKRPSSS